MAHATPQNRQLIGSPASIRAMQAALRRHASSWGAAGYGAVVVQNLEHQRERGARVKRGQQRRLAGYGAVVVQNLEHQRERGARVKRGQQRRLAGLADALLARPLLHA
ncbi:hypothetical protein CRUP_036501 [Coryphaenoides rupestris]|nr:hypothetical protein CRUP_036501 [Coryphaenoides rupestris]